MIKIEMHKRCFESKLQNCQNQFGKTMAFEKPQIISRSRIQIGNREKLALETYRVISWRVGFPCVTGLLVKFQWLACAELSSLYHTSDCWVWDSFCCRSFCQLLSNRRWQQRRRLFNHWRRQSTARDMAHACTQQRKPILRRLR